MKFFIKSLQVLLLVVFSQQISISQTCPSINAQAGTGPSTTICFGQCANLTATVIPVKATSTYSVGSIAYSPFAFSGGTAAIGNIDDLWSSTINIGFNFCYFGNTFNQLLVGSNGEITFDISRANGPEDFSTNNVLPNLIEHPGNTICVAYRDIDPSSGGSSSVFTYTTGVAPCRKFVAYWSAIPTYSCTSQLATFQVVLHEGTNIIETYITSSTPCTAWQSGRGLMGIQNSTGTTAVAPATRNVLTSWTATNEAWRYVPTGANTFTVNWTGPSGFTATGLTAAPCPTATSNYTATMNVSDCAGAITSYSSTVQVSVTPTPTTPIVATATAICRGSSSVLSATGATTYSWIPGGATTTSITVSPTVTTTYTLTRINGSCSTTQTISLVVNANPTVTATRTPTVLCSNNSATLTSTGAISYTWNPGALVGNTVVVSPTVTTQYTVTGTNATGCTATRTVNLLVSATPTITALTSTSLACSGSSVTLTSSGASTYVWTPGNLTGAAIVVTPTVNTTYTVTGRNAAGCSGTNTVNVTVSPGITFTASASPTVICRGGTSTITATGASTYTWLPGSSTSSVISVSPLNTTVYTVTASNGGACSATKFITVTVSIPNITAASAPASICLGSSSTLTAGGGVTYTWAPGGMTGTPVVVSPTATTVYTVTGTNALGCTNTRAITLTVLANPTVNISASSATLCPSFSSTLTASGGTSYTWTPGSFTTTAITVTPSVSSTYTVRGRNASGCTATNTIGITVNPSVTVSPISSPSIICRGNSSTLTATGASTYTWNPGALTGSNVAVSPIVTTTYTITGTDINGCNSTATLGVNVSTLNVTATSNPTILCSSSTATLTSTGAGTYTWEPGSMPGNTVVVTPASTTIYTVTGTNALGCTASRTLNLSVGITPTVTAGSSSSTVCAGTTLTLSSNGASTYTWLPGSLIGSTVTASPSTNTTYTVRGQNASGCIGTNTVFVSVNPVPTVTTTNTPLILCSGNTGTLSANGASTYTWNPGNLSGATITVSPLATTVYTVVGTSSLNCTGSATVNLKVTATPTIGASSSPTIICAGSSATLSGTGAVSYTWNPGALTGNSVTVIPSVNTTYTLTGDNGFGCLSTNTIVLMVNATPTITAGSSPTIICAGSSATLTANGANSYTWSPINIVGSSAVDSPTLTTTYTVNGEDINGCTSTQTVSVLVSSPSVTTTASSNTICVGSSATLTASGALTYTWNPGSLTGASAVVYPTSTTTYTVDGDNGICLGTQTITINVSSLPTLTTTASSNTICVGSSATLTANGATSYTWNPGSVTGSSAIVSPTSTTTYTVDGDNGLGCIASETITINVNSAPSVSVIATPTALCAGGSVTLTASGAATYTWNPTGTIGTSIVDTPTLTTTYTVTGEDAIGCNNTQTVTINISSPSITITPSSATICSGSSTTLTANGATSYTWNPTGTVGASVVDSPTLTTTYTVIGEDAIGCTNMQTVSVNVSSIPSLSTTTSSNSICAGSSATLTANGATSYTWNPGSITGTSAVVSPTSTTTYTVDGDNGLGCIASETITINVNALPSLSVTSTPTALCAAGSVTLTASGANTYTWNPTAATTASVVDTPSLTTTYTVTGEDIIGCANSETITISVGNPTINIVSNPAALCVGGTAILTASGATSYTWSPLAVNGATVTDSPTVTTTYTVTGDNGTCIGTETITLVVSPSATVITSATPSVICAGASATLSASGATTYTWNPGVLTGTNVAVTPTTTTTYTVDADNGLGCITSETVTINVNAAPSISIAATPTVLCAAGSVTLIASGANTYTWNPTSATTASIVDTPTLTTTYTVTGEDAIGCTNTQTVSINVSSIPSLSITTSSNSICAGSPATLTANGATSYTWNPGSITGTSAVVSPTSTTTYTVDGDNGLGCIASETITINVNSAPSVSVIATPTTLCASGSATLTASGAATYTWNPTSLTGASIVDTPTITTTYTVTGEDAIGCNNTQTVTITVGISPANITASVSNNITCSNPTVSLTGNSTDVGVDYLWTGPGSYSSAIQNPTDIITAGDYTLNVINPLSGCSTTTIISVSSNTIVPDITATSSGSLGCNNSVTITAISTSTNTLNYTWFGPSSYTSSVQSPTTNIAGDYTISITDITNGCVNSSSTTVGTNTSVPSFTANVIAATCSGAIANNDGTILLSGFNASDNYDLVQASTYTGSASYGSATPIPTNGIITNTLNNPSVAIPYTIRIFSANGCFSDTSVNLTPASCLTVTTSIGVAKSGSVSGVLADKTLDVTYVITVKNLGTDTINFVQVTDSLVIPTPATFSIKSGPTTTGSLTANSNYNGNSDIGLLISGSSKLAPGQSETITFILNITPNGLNSITNIAIAAGFGELGNIVQDTSNTGNEPDPNGNNNATESGENIPTVLQLPDVNLFVPEVFTPDGDGKNDFFVIKGIEGRTVKIIVFNRWGNKVYENESYDNTWGGMPNVSGLIIGNNKLPQGTYYYIVEFEDGVDKPINGYVVLQY